MKLQNHLRAARIERSPSRHATPFERLRSFNAGFAERCLAESILPSARSGPFSHGRITANDGEGAVGGGIYQGGDLNAVTTGNASLFGATHFSEPMTNYAVNWTDEEGYETLTSFLAPQIEAPGEIFQHLVFDNAEQFLGDTGASGNYQLDIRPINRDFKTIDYTPGITTRNIANRGLRIELDWDRIKNDPIWEQRYTGMLMARLKRNQALRAVALAVASGTADTLAWSNISSNLPDIELANEKLLCKDSSGLSPSNGLIGDTAWQNRLTGLAALSSGNQFAAAAELARDINALASWLQMELLLDGGRLQSGTTKTRIVGAYVIFLNSKKVLSVDDPSNFKLAWVNTQTGARWAVYIRQIGVKRWEIVVEHYELLFAATTLGCRVITTS